MYPLVAMRRWTRCSELVLSQMATAIRSKNAGPFELTLDVFDDEATYRQVARSGMITPATVSARYGIAASQVVGIHFFEAARGIKITLKRPVPSGSPGERDTYGAQQHAPLLGWEVPKV
jgi:hypothetical protein